MSTHDLPERFRRMAKRLRRYAPAAAQAYRDAATQLERALRDDAARPVTRAELARLANVHPDSVSRAAAEGRIQRQGKMFRAEDADKLRCRSKPPAPPASTSPATDASMDAFTRRTVANRTRGGARHA